MARQPPLSGKSSGSERSRSLAHPSQTRQTPVGVPVVAAARYQSAVADGDEVGAAAGSQPGRAGSPAANVFIQHSRDGESVFTEQMERLAAGLDPTSALVMLPEDACCRRGPAETLAVIAVCRRAPMAMRPAVLTCRPTPSGGTRNPRHRRSGRRCSC